MNTEFNSLTELSKHDAYLRDLAIKMAKGNKEIGEDALHEAYLRVHTYFQTTLPVEPITFKMFYRLVGSYIQ
jgi:DNA-directed RNA polymerase specialized sigma24 family protein